MAALSPFFFLFGLGCAAVFGGLSVLLVFVGETPVAPLFAVGGFLLSFVPLLIWYSWDADSWKRKATVMFCLAGGLGIFTWLGSQAPGGHSSSGARVQNRYSCGVWKFRRYALGNILPESDQLLLGYKVVPLLDSLFTYKEARDISLLTSSIYRPLEADPDFHALGSVMPEAYHDLSSLPYSVDHYFLYIPPKLDRRQPHPALVFLHGSGGNFKAYTWLLSRVADELGMVLIAPSDGMGNWEKSRSSKIVASALADAEKVVTLDHHHFHLMGLSNGGLGVSQVACATGGDFRTLTFLSPVFDKAAIKSDQFAQKWRDRPVLVISGKADDRVPFSYVTERVATMTSAGAKVTLMPVPAADHFMLFSHRDLILGAVTAWLRERDKA